jgi:hypothetical protein
MRTTTNSPSFTRRDAMMTSPSPSPSLSTSTTTPTSGINNNSTTSTSGVQGSGGGGRKKKLALGGAWSFDTLAAELLALSSYDQRKPHSSIHTQRATYDKKDRLVMLGDAAYVFPTTAPYSFLFSIGSVGMHNRSEVEIDDWETPTTDNKSSSSSSNGDMSRNGNKNNKTNTTIRSSSNGDGVTFAAPSGASDDDDDDDESKTKQREDTAIVTDGQRESKGIVDYDSDSDGEQPTR